MTVEKLMDILQSCANDAEVLIGWNDCDLPIKTVETLTTWHETNIDGYVRLSAE